MTCRRLYAAICLATSIFTIDLTACTPVQPAATGLTDPARRDPLAEEHWKIGHVSTGTKLVVTTRDSGRVVGRYQGFRHLDDDEYSTRYAARMADSAATARCFAIGTHVLLIGDTETLDSGTFSGFDYGVVRYQRAGERRVRVAPLDRLERLEDGSGGAVRGDSLTAWLDAGQLPLATVLVLRDQGRVRELPLENIRALHANGVPAAVAILVAGGFLVGIIVAYANAPRPKPQPANCGGTYPTSW